MLQVELTTKLVVKHTQEMEVANATKCRSAKEIQQIQYPFDSEVHGGGDAIESTSESVAKGQHNSKARIRVAYHSRDVLMSFAWYIMMEAR